MFLTEANLSDLLQEEMLKLNVNGRTKTQRKLIYSESKKNKVTIHNCTFIGNSATASENDNNLYGGNVLYLIPRSLSLTNNYFRANNGEGSDVIIVNVFRKSAKSVSLLKKLMKSKEEILLISNCLFEISKNSDSSIFFLLGNYGSQFEVKKYTLKKKNKHLKKSIFVNI